MRWGGHPKLVLGHPIAENRNTIINFVILYIRGINTILFFLKVFWRGLGVKEMGDDDFCRD